MVDLVHLAQAVFPQAQGFLEKWDDFTPFGVGVTEHEELVPLVPTDPGQSPGQDDLIRWVEDTLRQGAEDGRWRAVAVCHRAKVRRPDRESPGGEAPADAIFLHLESRDGAAIDAALPYTFAAGLYSYGEVIAQDAARRIL